MFIQVSVGGALVLVFALVWGSASANTTYLRIQTNKHLPL